MWVIKVWILGCINFSCLVDWEIFSVKCVRMRVCVCFVFLCARISTCVRVCFIKLFLFNLEWNSQNCRHGGIEMNYICFFFYFIRLWWWVCRPPPFLSPPFPPFPSSAQPCLSFPSSGLPPPPPPPILISPGQVEVINTDSIIIIETLHFILNLYLSWISSYPCILAGGTLGWGGGGEGREIGDRGEERVLGIWGEKMGKSKGGGEF